MERDEIAYVIFEALRLLDAGETREAVAARFPVHRADLETVFQIIDRLGSAGETVLAEKNLLSKILLALPDVTRAPAKRFTEYKDEHAKGRTLLVRQFPIHTFMTMQMKVILSFLVVAVLAGGVYFLAAPGTPKFSLREGGEAPLSQGMPAGDDASVEEAVVSSAPSTGNPDDIANEIIASALQESAILDDADADGSFVDFDAGVAGEFGQFSYE